MSLMKITDYPKQFQRGKESADYQSVVDKLSQGINGIDIAYGEDIYQRIALFVPEKPNGIVLVYIHGGRWSYGFKESAAFMAPTFNSAGITLASIGYRLYPNRYKSGISDVSTAIDWLVKYLGEYGVDINKLFISGHSSGGHYAAQLSVTYDWLDKHKLPYDLLSGCLPISGVYDLTEKGYKGEGRPPCLPDGSDGVFESPMFRMDKLIIPFLITYGSNDYSFLIPQAKEFALSISEHGGEAETLELQGKNHFTVHCEGAASDGEWINRAITWIRQH